MKEMSAKLIIRLMVFRYWFKMLFAWLVVILMPAAAIASGIAAYGILTLAQVPQTPLEIARGLSDKNLAYWFMALAGLAVMSWTFFGKWLLDQLNQQRSANQAITVQLIDYMKGDHAAMIAMMGKLSDILERIIKRLDADFRDQK